MIQIQGPKRGSNSGSTKFTILFYFGMKISFSDGGLELGQNFHLKMCAFIVMNNGIKLA